nr:hypothetical protein [Paraburkholderia mimosarum]
MPVRQRQKIQAVSRQDHVTQA